MARLGGHTFELNSLTLEPGAPAIGASAWANFNGGGTDKSVVTTAPRSGSYCLKMPVDANLRYIGLDYAASATSTRHDFSSVAMMIATAPNAQTTVIFVNETTRNTVVARVKVNANRTLELVHASTTIGTSSTALTLNTWYVLQLEVDGSPSAGSDVIRLRIYDADGLNLLETVESTTLTITNTWQRFEVGSSLSGADGGTSGDIRFDDVMINDTSGTVDTSWPDPREKHVACFATANGSGDARKVQGTDWDTGPSTGGAALDMVDETPLPDDATSYLEFLTAASAFGTGVSFYFGVEAASGKGASSNIPWIMSCHRHGASTALTRTHRAAVKSSSGSSESSDYSIGQTAWRTEARMHYTDPGTGSAWAAAEVDAVQVGVRPSGDVSPAPRVTAVWVIVAYLPAAAAKAPPPFPATPRFTTRRRYVRG